MNAVREPPSDVSGIQATHAQLNIQYSRVAARYPGMSRQQYREEWLSSPRLALAPLFTPPNEEQRYAATSLSNCMLSLTPGNNKVTTPTIDVKCCFEGARRVCTGFFPDWTALSMWIAFKGTFSCRVQPPPIHSPAVDRRREIHILFPLALSPPSRTNDVDQRRERCSCPSGNPHIVQLQVLWTRRLFLQRRQ